MLSEALPVPIESTTSRSSAPDTAPEGIPPPKQIRTRISIGKIDKALSGYDGGDTLSRKVIGQNDCIGVELYRYRLSNQLVLEGNPHSIYAVTWMFSGDFQPVMGLMPGMGMDQVVDSLGKPVLRTKDRLVYWSKKPNRYDSSYFDSRWKIWMRFSNDSLKSVLFEPYWDNC
ncbi:MAG: hypothetical protein IPN71_00365 [Fibrobacteres bacterium]|nr:hypothetical protein [Fibrobacterota bacterium]